jgi:DNA ligase (NAD+)
MNKIQKLASLILNHKTLYYNGNPEISDEEYDRLEDELRQLDPNHYVLSMVGTLGKKGANRPDAAKLRHKTKMLSLDKTYDVEKLLEWIGEEEVISTYKIDGVSCSLIYEDGKLVIAKTRGDGYQGENIKDKVMWISAINKTIEPHEKLEVRGEIFCKGKDFIKLAQVMEARGMEIPKNPRNIVSGLLGRKDKIDLCQYLSFVAFEALCGRGEEKFSSEFAKLQFLEEQNFVVPDFSLHREGKTVEVAIAQAQKYMENGEFGIDGLVFTYNRIGLHRELGETAHHPKYKMAFKFKGESRVVVLKEVIWQVSRNGVLTPVGLIEPTLLSGAMISRITLHNYGMVIKHNLKVGDSIEVIRSGEVIPKFLGVVTHGIKEIAIPVECPSCHSKLEIRDIRLYCLNPDCMAKKKQVILNFLQKGGVELISKKRVDEMLSKELIQSAWDLFDLREEDFLQLDNVKEKQAHNFYTSLQKAKKIDLVDFLTSLGIAGGALQKCEKLINARYDSLEKIQALTVEDLTQIEGFAEKSATDFLNSLKEKEQLIEELLKRGITITPSAIDASETDGSNPKKLLFKGKKFCITGALSRPRAEIEKEIKAFGGTCQSTVNKETSYLVCNETDSSSSKMKKAQQLGISIVNESELNSLMK